MLILRCSRALTIGVYLFKDVADRVIREGLKWQSMQLDWIMERIRAVR